MVERVGVHVGEGIFVFIGQICMHFEVVHGSFCGESLAHIFFEKGLVGEKDIRGKGFHCRDIGDVRVFSHEVVKIGGATTPMANDENGWGDCYVAAVSVAKSSFFISKSRKSSYHGTDIQGFR